MNKKIISIIIGAAAVVVILLLILSLTMCGREKPEISAGGGVGESTASKEISIEESTFSEDPSAEGSKGKGKISVKNDVSKPAESEAQTPYNPAEDLNVAWYDTGLDCPITDVDWENFTDDDGVSMIRSGGNSYPAPEEYFYEDGSMFGACYQQVGEPDVNEIYTIKVYKNGAEVPQGTYMDESMVYRVFDGRDGSVTDHRICISMSLGGEGTNFSHEMWTANRKFTVAPNTSVTAPKYFDFYAPFGMSVKIFDGGKEATGGMFKEGMFARVSKNGGADFWDYKVVIDPSFVTYAYNNLGASTAAAVTPSDLSAKFDSAKQVMPDNTTLASFDGAYECMGFAMWLYDQVWGTTVRKEPNSRKHRDVNKLCVGDYVRYYYHSIVIIDIQGDTIIYVDQNGGPAYNKVKWGRKTTKSALQQKLNVALPGEYLTPDGYGFIVNHQGNDVKSLSYSPYGSVNSYYPEVSGVAADIVDKNRTAKIDIYIHNKDEGNRQYGGAYHIDANLPDESSGNKKFAWTADWSKYPTGHYEITVIALSGDASAEIGRAVKYHENPVPRLEGHLDGYKGIINGWAYDKFWPDENVDVNIRILNSGGQTVASKMVLADKLRGDLIDAGKGNGYHGFELNFDWTTLPDGQYKIDAHAERGGDRTYLGEFSDKRYNLVFHNNDGSGAVNTYNKWENDDFVVPMPTRSGHDFIGWATDPFATEGKYAAGSSIKSNDEKTFYAVWQKVYHITYNANGGTGAPQSQKKLPGENIALSLEIPEKEGNNFLNWTDGNTVYSPGDTYSADADIALSAVWQIKTYKITFLTGGRVWAGPTEVIKQHGVSYQIPAIEPAANDKVFAGWYTAGGSEKEYAPGDMFEENADVFLTAIWYDKTKLILGDIDNNGVVDVTDASLGMQIVTGILLDVPVGEHECGAVGFSEEDMEVIGNIELSGKTPNGWYARANVDGEAGITINDARIILEMCTGEEIPYKREEDY